MVGVAVALAELACSAQWAKPRDRVHACAPHDAGGAHSAHVAEVAPAEVGFDGLDVDVSGTDLAWLYNLVASLARAPITDAITREVASQARARPAPASSRRQHVAPARRRAPPHRVPAAGTGPCLRPDAAAYKGLSHLAALLCAPATLTLP